ncbi:MAG: threonine/serine exporter family protein [Clostridia bacterium]|nr:threonine/serine exporter family protein [Clostridia bacterium]
MSLEIIQLITSFLGSLGFALIFNLKKKRLFLGSMGGVFCWGAYLITTTLYNGVFISTLVASAVAAAYAEIFARIIKAPATVIFMSAIIPLIPGSSLFYTMSHIVSGEIALFKSYGITTILYVLGITSGISIVWSAWYMLRKIYNIFFKTKRDSQ